MSSNHVLTKDQEQAYESFCKFMLSPDETYMVIEGYAGTGKSFLVGHILENLPKWGKMIKLVHPEYKPLPILLTATTNKACSALTEFVSSTYNDNVITIHSALNLTLQRNKRTGDLELTERYGYTLLTNQLIFIDEASYIDHTLLNFIKTRIKDCKIVFVGDPAQLTNFRCAASPVFNQGYRTATMKEVKRQGAESPIQKLSAAFRNTVNTGKFFSFVPDGSYVTHMTEEDWTKELIKEFTNPAWQNNSSKILTWTNKSVQAYNKLITTRIKGSPEFHVGDLATVNSYVSSRSGYALKTDEIVCISRIRPAYDKGFPGWEVEVDQKSFIYFLPKDWQQAEAYKKQLKKDRNYTELDNIRVHWIDLRATYACTVNKAQGSSFDKVFIDLNDIARCKNPNQLARMLYVSVSRPKSKIIFTGDLV